MKDTHVQNLFGYSNLNFILLHTRLEVRLHDCNLQVTVTKALIRKISRLTFTKKYSDKSIDKNNIKTSIHYKKKKGKAMQF